MKPDICVIRQDDSVAAIIDTKWKLLDDQDPASKYGVQQADIYQVASYADAYECSNIALWYPFSPALRDQSLTVFDFLRRGSELTGRNLSVNAMDLQPGGSGVGWRTHLQAQARKLLAAVVGIELPPSQAVAIV
jgi:5-methylcytosine-specific restriction endonuclease McrBC regulatory subunit McrC